VSREVDDWEVDALGTLYLVHTFPTLKTRSLNLAAPVLFLGGVSWRAFINVIVKTTQNSRLTVDRYLPISPHPALTSIRTNRQCTLAPTNDHHHINPGSKQQLHRPDTTALHKNVDQPFRRPVGLRPHLRHPQHRSRQPRSAPRSRNDRAGHRVVPTRPSPERAIKQRRC